MRTTRLCRFWLIILGSLAGAVALAQEQALTAADVEQYIDSLHQIEPLAERINADEGADAATMAELWLKGDKAAVVDHLKQKEYYDDLEGAVSEAGYDNVREWVDTAQRVTQAYMAVEIGDQGPAMAAELEQGREQIRQSPHFSEEQKETLIAQLEQTQAQLANIDAVSPADRAAIQPYMDQLRQHFQAEPVR